MDDQSERRTQALRRLWAKRALKIHAGLYLAMSALVVVIWAMTGRGYFWPIWPIAGAAVGLALHAWIAFGLRPIPEDLIQQEMARDSQRGHRPLTGN